MELTPCIGGGINVESGSGGGGGVFIAIGLGVVIGYTVAVLDDFLETFPLDTPTFEPLPGLIPPEIEQEIIPCGDSSTAPPFELPPFDVHFPSIDDIFSADPIEPGIELPNVLEANSGWFDEIYYNGTPISGTRANQRARERPLLRDLSEEYPDIRSNEWRKVEQWFEYEGEEYDLHWFEARGITERGKVD